MDYQNSPHELHSQSLISREHDFKQVENALAYQKDVEYMKQLLPSSLQVIQAEIDEECDKLEYSGSVMFDEFPDKNHLRMIVDNIMHRLTDSETDGEVSGQSLDWDGPDTPSYCPDDAMLDCEEEISEEMTVEATGLEGPGPVQNGWFGPGWGPGWFPPPPPPHGPGSWGFHGPRRRGRCFGPSCPISNRRCGRGRWCPPVPFADFDDKGNRNWMRHLVENMLVNEMTYRRSRYRNHNL